MAHAAAADDAKRYFFHNRVSCCVCGRSYAATGVVKGTAKRGRNILLKRSPPTTKGCTPKALIVGLLGALCIGLGSTYNDMIVKGSGLAVWNLTPAAIFLFFVLVVLLNPLLKLLHPRLPMQRGELGRGLLPDPAGQHPVEPWPARATPTGHHRGLLLRHARKTVGPT